MNSFDDREKTAEKKFVLDAATEFKTEARRNKKLALWASELMQKSELETKAYVGEVILADMEEGGDDDVFRKLRGDFTSSGVEISDTAIRDKMSVMMEEAREEILQGI